MELAVYFRSVLEQDTAPVVLCDTKHTILYMNPAAERHYGCLMGKNLTDCHTKAANERIEKVLTWFSEDKSHNRIYTFRNDAENKDVYMVALRDAEGGLIGYYEKHEYRDRERQTRYDFTE